ncbi:hypothetical protein [Clostridium manihotivorum]|uniref:Uncharacterized protein n=1 Tax=Clostridium manihotivorum TaxID=2320868 RepID=A0A3R5QXH7_9CLOT|nr:hypothetical protein [Clostridium manihotivorum]QAA31773.1 hypothetical protein C1I91_09010 [Clostridium manihotivorum]
MIRFYLKVINNIFIKNLLYIIFAVVVLFNILIRVMPYKFINISTMFQGVAVTKKVPNELYMYCDVYLLLLFVILIFFTLGVDFNNSMEDISLAIGGSRTNKFMIRKLISILLVYFFLYSVSFFNIYYLYKKILPSSYILTPILEVLFYSIVTNLFIISLSLFILFISRDIAVSTSLITVYYLIEEALWRCKVMGTSGILGHIYQYTDYKKGELLEVKVIYIILSIILLTLTFIMTQRKASYSIIKKGFQLKK